MNIRSYTDDDLPAVLDIYARSKLDELIYESEHFELLALEQDQLRLSQLMESDIFVYDDDGVIAYGALFGSEIRALFVHPNNRGCGLGKLLLSHLLSQARRPASLSVAKSNIPAKNLYQNFGFKVVDEFETSYNGVRVLANKMECIEHLPHTSGE
ncbi:MAG: GNAT family N-acetyltransferase [Arenicella sp.]